MRAATLILAVLALCASLSACGLKGDLYLPEPKAAAAASPDPAPPAPAADQKKEERQD